ncbi:hypothetical protein T492DRAFT_1048254 [Pavlovales sp. CCMP2436]|nr:hypothetical protein T492DRAFT_1048254 [Pavlovales sp. CCMP2436]
MSGKQTMGGASGRLGGLVGASARQKKAASMVVHVRVAPPALGKAAAVPDSAFDVMTKAFEDTGRVGELEQHNVGLQAQIITLQKQLTPPAANPGARVIGKNASDRTVLTSASRNQTVTIKPKGNYNQHNYTFADDSRGVPKWLSRRDENHKNSLPQAGGVKGGGTVLRESAERELCKTMGRAALANMPYQYVEVEDAVRNTAIELRRVVAKTGKVYDSLTDVSTLVKSFIVRMAKEGIYFIEKHGRKLGLQPLYMCLKHYGNQFVAPFEQSPHWTLIIGFVGVVQMELLAIMKGTDNLMPSPFHAQLPKGGDGVYLGQTATGWVNNPLKLVFANLQIDKGIIGKRPIVINVDGYDSNQRRAARTYGGEQGLSYYNK